MDGGNLLSAFIAYDGIACELCDKENIMNVLLVEYKNQCYYVDENCAKKILLDDDEPRKQIECIINVERRLYNYSQHHGWRKTKNGNWWLRKEGYRILVCRNNKGTWSVMLNDQWQTQIYHTADNAKETIFVNLFSSNMDYLETQGCAKKNTNNVRRWLDGAHLKDG